jgi:hypothetical protein
MHHHTLAPAPAPQPSQAFAESLSATHILRVADGTARLSDNLGLSAVS